MLNAELEQLLSGATKTEAFISGAVVGGVIAFFAGIAILFAVLQIIAAWKVFEKAGEKGWKSLIPFYNIYIFFRILGIKEWYFWVFLGGIVVTSAMTANANVEIVKVGTEYQYVFNGFDNPAVIIGEILTAALAIVTMVWVARNGAKAFGKGTGFAVCLFFFPDICWLILGLGKSKYHKKAVIEAEAEAKEDK